MASIYENGNLKQKVNNACIPNLQPFIAAGFNPKNLQILLGTVTPLPITNVVAALIVYTGIIPTSIITTNSIEKTFFVTFFIFIIPL